MRSNWLLLPKLDISAIFSFVSMFISLNVNFHLNVKQNILMRKNVSVCVWGGGGGGGGGGTG